MSDVPHPPLPPSESFITCRDTTRRELADAWARYQRRSEEWRARAQLDLDRARELKEQAEKQCGRMSKRYEDERKRRDIAEAQAFAWRKELVETTVQLQAEKNDAYLDRSLVLALATQFMLDADMGNPRMWLDPDQDAEWRFVVAADLPDAGQVTWHVHVDQAEELFRHLLMVNNEWDGHTTQDRRERLVRSIVRYAPPPSKTPN